MTDFFLVLMLPGAGDELQGLKKGVVELADMIAINKADGDNMVRAKAAAAEYRAALHILSPRSANWSPPVVTYSALTGEGIPDLWAKVLDHRERLTASGELINRRGEQQVKWMWAMLEERLFAPLRSDRALKAALPRIEAEVAAGKLAPAAAVEEIVGMLGAEMRVLSYRLRPLPRGAEQSQRNPGQSARPPAAAGFRRRSFAPRTYLLRPTMQSISDLPKLFAQKPDIVLMFGLAGSRRHVSIETRARNAVSLLYPDASGHRPERGIIVRADERCKATRRSPICSVRCEVAQSPPASRATPGDIFATTPIGARWTAPATVTRWFSSFIFRASDLIRGADAKAARLLSVRW